MKNVSSLFAVTGGGGGNEAMEKGSPASSDSPERMLGELIGKIRRLDDDAITRIASFQRQHGLRFGEAAVALKLATSEEVLWALSQQYQYAYAPDLKPGAVAELVTATQPFGDDAEAFRELRSQLMMGVLGGPQRKALAILSPDVGDGKTYIAANVAAVFSQLEGRTLLIDADVRTPRQHLLFGVDSTVGLSGLLSGRYEGEAILPVHGLPNLFLMPAGPVPPNPLELLQRPAFGLLIQELLHKFDHVIVDTPAARHGADARVIAAKAGAALVIGREGSSKLDSMKVLLKSLEKTPTSVAGVVINER